MSQLGGGGSQQIGGVSIGVSTTGAQQAAADLNKTAAAAQNLGNTAQAAATKLNTVGGAAAGGLGASLGAAGKNLKESVKDVRGFLGGIRAVESVAFRIVGQFALIGTLVTAIAYGIREGWRFLVNHGKGLKELSESWQTVLEQQKEYSATLEQIAKATALGGPAGAPAIVKNINQARVKELEKTTRESEPRRNELQALINEQELRVANLTLLAGQTGDYRDKEALGLARADLKRLQDALKKLVDDVEELSGYRNRAATGLSQATETFRLNALRRVTQESRTSADMDVDRTAAPLEAIAGWLSRMEPTGSGRDQ